LRQNKTAGVVPEIETPKLYELFLVGCSFHDIHVQHPQYSLPSIILTAALRGWCKDREKMLGSLRDRVQAKVVKSVIEQVDFLTTMLSVVNAEHMDSMRKYVLDPVKNKKPDVRVESIKEYKEVVETLQKLVAGATGSNKRSSPMFDALNPQPKTLPANHPEEDTFDPADVIAGELVK
jgi:hypothetical protein